MCFSPCVSEGDRNRRAHRVGDGYFSGGGCKADIPHFLTAAVVHVPRGAAPGACYGYYEPDDAFIRFLELKDAEALDRFLSEGGRRL